MAEKTETGTPGSDDACIAAIKKWPSKVSKWLNNLSLRATITLWTTALLATLTITYWMQGDGRILSVRRIFSFWLPLFEAFTRLENITFVAPLSIFAIGVTITLRKHWEKLTELPLFWTIAIWVLLGIAMLTVTGWLWSQTGMPYLSWKRLFTIWQPESAPETKGEFIKQALTLVGGIGAVGYLVMKYREQAAFEREEVARRLTEAVELLGSPTTQAKIAGIHSLTEIADSDSEYRQRVVNILCGFLRTSTKTTGTYLPISSDPTISEGQSELPPHRIKSDPSEATIQSEILKVITARLRNSDAPSTHSTTPDTVSWTQCNFDFSGTIFVTKVDFSHCKTHGELNFAKCVFTERTAFIQTTFEHFTKFNACYFASKADFNNSTFKTKALFGKTTFAATANFSHCTFSDDASFGGSTFEEQALFNESHFHGKATLTATKFKARANFRQAIFEMGTDFSTCEFLGKTLFAKCSFRDILTFEKSIFASDAQFDESTFDKKTSFLKCIFKEPSQFISTTFHDHANFRSAKFLSATDFTKAKFRGPSKFSSIHFGAAASFVRCEIISPTTFKNATFAPGTNFAALVLDSTISFKSCTFLGAARFYNIAITENVTFEDVQFSHAWRTQLINSVKLSPFGKLTLNPNGLPKGARWDDEDRLSNNSGELEDSSLEGDIALPDEH